LNVYWQFDLQGYGNLEGIVVVQELCKFGGTYTYCEERDGCCKVTRTIKCPDLCLYEVFFPKKVPANSPDYWMPRDFHQANPVSKPGCTSAGTIRDYADVRVVRMTPEVLLEIVEKFRLRPLFFEPPGCPPHTFYTTTGFSRERPRFMDDDLVLEGYASHAVVRSWNCCERPNNQQVHITIYGKDGIITKSDSWVQGGKK
jgi:hypothetical protein